MDKFCSADLVLINGHIVTVDPKESIAEAVGVKSGRIIAVGTNEGIKSLVSGTTRIIDLKGKTVIPGLIDPHCHLTLVAWAHSLCIDGSYESGVRSIADLQARISEQTKVKPAGDWINVEREDDSKLTEKRHPNRWELDEAAPNHPVMVITIGSHFAIVNSKAFEKAGITKSTPDPVGGRFERDPTTGELTGWIYEASAIRAVQPIRYGREPTMEEAMSGLRWIMNQFVSSGLTCVNDGLTSSGVLVNALLELRNRGELPLRVRLDYYHELLDHLIKLGIGNGFGDEMLKLSSIKIVTDGAISARTAAVAEPYLHRPGYLGELAITKEVLYDIIMKGYAKGYRFAGHANGERAIDMFLDIIEEAQKKYPRKDPRNRVIHCTVVNAEIVARIKKLGLLPTIFGPYPYYHGDKILPAFGATRLERMFAARSFLDAGIKVSAHSDHSASPFPPLMGIHALVNRTSANGAAIGRSQRISIMEALKLYTIYAAYCNFDEDILGSLEPGKYADMVVLGKDILKVPNEEIINIPVEMTLMSGKVVYP